MCDDVCGGDSSFDGGGCTSFSTDTGCESISYVAGNDNNSSGIISLPTDTYNSIDDSTHYSQESVKYRHARNTKNSVTPSAQIWIAICTIVIVVIILFILIFFYSV